MKDKVPEHHINVVEGQVALGPLGNVGFYYEPGTKYRVFIIPRKGESDRDAIDRTIIEAAAKYQTPT